jgi:CRP/FNR family cyclic AMP-dependent transcriptional regulator
MVEDDFLLETLQQCSLFSGFTKDILLQIVPCLSFANYEPGQIIFLKDDPSESLHIIIEGSVDISVASEEGRDILLSTLSKGDVFGEIGLFDNKGRTANVIARSKLRTLILSANDYHRIYKNFGEVELKAINNYICNLFRRVTNNLEETLFLDSSVRVARRLLELYEESGVERTENSFNVTLSQEDLGRMVSLSREATNKALSKLQKKGLIEKKYKKIYVPDITKLYSAVGN